MARTYNYPERVAEEVVRAIPAPERTKSWNPLSHATCIDVVSKAVDQLGLKVQNRLYSISETGGMMYAAWGVTMPNNLMLDKEQPKWRIYPAVIFRNSVDMSLSFGVNSGTFAYICDNLAMDGRFIEFRKHTGGLTEEELFQVVMKGMTGLMPRLEASVGWHNALRGINLDVNQTKALAYDAIQARIISQKKLPNFNSMLFGEHHVYEPTSLFGFHGACTELMRDMRLTGGFEEKQWALNDLINTKFPQLVAAPAPTPVAEVPTEAAQELAIREREFAGGHEDEDELKPVYDAHAAGADDLPPEELDKLMDEATEKAAEKIIKRRRQKKEQETTPMAEAVKAGARSNKKSKKSTK